ncbi:hypothetical protein OPQ81_005579 [Rhizoctonia solani]|nr:hypothetical protein OPQ81_005579 [Rhizoctonia solani]
MKLTLRTLQQKSFEVDAEPEDTVLNLKEKVGSIRGEAVEHIKLFYSGRALSDNQKSVESLNIKEGTYVLLMVVKPKPEVEDDEFNTNTMATNSFSMFAPTTIPRPAFTNPVPPTNPTPSTSFNSPSHNPVPTPSTFSASQPAITSQPTMGSFGNNKWMEPPKFETSISEDSVNNLVGMGFERDQARKALKASYGNTERAVEYLTTKIPEDALDEPPSSTPQGFRPFGVSNGPSSSGPFSSAGSSSSSFRPFGASSGSFSFAGSSSSAFRPSGTPSMFSPFVRPQPTEMVGYIEEVDPDQPEEPSKPVDSEPAPPSPSPAAKEGIKPSEPISSATTVTSSTPLPTHSKDTPPASSSAQSVAPSLPSFLHPCAPTPPSASEPLPSVISRPTPSASSSNSMPSRPDFSALSALGGFGNGSSGETVTLESLRNDPMVKRMRELLAENTELFGPLFEELVQSKPQIMGLLASDPAGLAQLFVQGGGSSRQDLNMQAICVTREEKDSIDRLQGLGFPLEIVIQAYFALDKDEQATAEYLVDKCAND